ncbi:hypothetical protein HPB50_029515 [Hyalomma asiaticum]|nr:hypothetical protein HPB50_029515 [Hyalomma asiaticum]
MGSVSVALSKLKRTVRSITGLIRGIACSKEGMTEADTLHLLHAFIISRITYALPFQATRRTESDQVDKLIRIAFKAALGIPESTSTDCLGDLGLTSTFEELTAATIIAQRERLNATTQARSLLRCLHHPLTPQFCGDETQLIPHTLRSQRHVAPIPRNMHPTFHIKRRRAMAPAMRKRQNDPDTYFTDAGLYPRTTTPTSAFVAVATNRSRTLAATSLRTSSSATAETAVPARSYADLRPAHLGTKPLTGSCHQLVSGTRRCARQRTG